MYSCISAFHREIMFYTFYYGSDIVLKCWPGNKRNLTACRLLTYLPTAARLFRFSLCLMFAGIRVEGGENEMQGRPYDGASYAAYGACGEESRWFGRKSTASAVCTWAG